MTKTGKRLIKSAKQAAEMAKNKALLEIVEQKHAALDRVAGLEAQLTRIHSVTEQMEAEGVMALIDTGLDSSDGVGPSDAVACFNAMLKAAKGGET